MGDSGQSFNLPFGNSKVMRNRKKSRSIPPGLNTVPLATGTITNLPYRHPGLPQFTNCSTLVNFLPMNHER